MFLDFPEIVIIFGVGLVVLGPKKLPAAAAKIGHWVGRARTMARQFREQIEQEINTVDGAFDTSTTRRAALKGTKPSSAAAPADSTIPPEDASSASPETLSEDPYLAEPGVGWQPDYGEPEAPLAPYGDPSAIPPPPDESSQLPLQLDPPPQSPQAPAAPAPPAPLAEVPAATTFADDSAIR